MTRSEAEAFEADPDFERYCQIRRWDEGAKVGWWFASYYQKGKGKAEGCVCACA